MKEPQRSRILLVDDHEVVLHGLTSLLASDPEFEVCGTAGDGVQALAQSRALNPDLVVMDLTMPLLNGLDAARLIIGEQPKVRILVLTMHVSDQLLREIVKSGAHGYVLKNYAGEELLAAVHAIRNAKTFFSSARESVARAESLIQTFRSDAVITPREGQVLKLLAEGCSNRQVADCLRITVKTVETHRGRIMHKLRFSSVADLVRYAIRNGYISA